MNRILIAALLVSLPAFAADFASRVAEAKRASATKEGAQYEAALESNIVAAIQSCIPLGSTDPANLGSFTLVGDVTANGALKSVAFEPETRVSTCFASRFSKALLPNPPKTNQAAGYPIVIEFKVVP